LVVFFQFEELLSQSGLLEATTRSNDFSAADMSSAERAARHGQLKQLREMKKGEIFFFSYAIISLIRYHFVIFTFLSFSL
jgi:hypothetical protein